MNVSPEIIKSALDVLTILRRFAHLPYEVSLGDVAKAAGFPKPKTYRGLATLVEAGFVQQDPVSRKYRLNYNILELSNTLLSHQSVRIIARPFLEALAIEIGEDITMAVPMENEVIFVDRISGGSRIRFFCDVGRRLPLHVGAAAKAILAHLPPSQLEAYLRALTPARLSPYTINAPDVLRQDATATRERGYSISNQEVEEGISAVGAAILDFHNHPVSGIAMASLTAKLDGARLTEWGKKISAVAREISGALGCRKEKHAARLQG